MTITIDDAPVKLLLSGIFKSGKTVFFKVDSTGKHEKVNVGLILRTLNLSHGAVSRLIAAFPWPELKYYSDYMRKADEAKSKPKETRVKPQRIVAEEHVDEEEIAEEESEDLLIAKDGKASKQFYIVQQGIYFGIYNSPEATVNLFKTKEEAEEQLQHLLHGRDGYHISYGGGDNKIVTH